MNFDIVNKTFSAVLLVAVAVMPGLWTLNSNAASMGVNEIDKVEASSITGQTLVKITLRNPLVTAPSSFTISSPPRVAFDFNDTENATGSNSQQVSFSDLQSLNVIQAGSRTRLILNLNRASRYETRVDGNVLYISMGGSSTTASQADAGSKSTLITAPSVSEGNTVQNVDFRADSTDIARVKLDLSIANPLIDVKRQGSSLVLFLQNVQLPERLARRLDMRDFGTPMVSLTTSSTAQGTQLVLTNRGEWDYNVTQMDASVKIEVRRIIADPNSLLGAKELSGKTVSFNFTQPVPVSQMLGIFQDITGLNFMMMPGVTGEIERLKMENTPIETAIDVISRMYGLSMRRFGDLVIVGKAADLAKYEKDENDLKSARLDAEPIEQESIKARFRPAAEIVAALTGAPLPSTSAAPGTTNNAQQPAGGQQVTPGTQVGAITPGAASKSLISARGSISFDPVTNTVFVEETRSQITKIRDRIEALDRPVRQVMIEARIVSVASTFAQSLGAKLGFSSTTTQKVGSLGGNEVNLGPLNFNTTMSAPGQTSRLAFSLFNPSQTRLLSLELTATENDGASKNIASPKILTQDGRQATITDGQTLFYQLAGGTSGPTTVSVDAATKLDVTPQIGADGKIQLKVNVNKGGVGTVTTNAGPSVTKQEITTNVVVENGGTLMLGGVFTEVQGDSTERVPVLGDIPYVGWLFKQNTKTRNRTELLIFLTPRIVTEELTLQ